MGDPGGTGCALSEDLVSPSSGLLSSSDRRAAQGAGWVFLLPFYSLQSGQEFEAQGEGHASTLAA